MIPRIGTISPWSSKASDIAQICSLATVRRIERGVEYNWSAADRLLTADELRRVSDSLHDRMTESVLFEAVRTEDLFASHVPARLVSVPLTR